MLLHNIIWFVIIGGQRIFNLYPDKRGCKYCLFMFHGGSTCRLHLKICFSVCNSWLMWEGRCAMVSVWGFVNVAACRAVSNPAWCRIFKEMSCFTSQYWDIVSMLCPGARHLTLKFFTLHRWKLVPVRTQMAMWMVSPMRRNGCRTVCSP